MANHGCPLTKTMAKAYAWTIAKRTGKRDRLIQKLVLEIIGGQGRI